MAENKIWTEDIILRILSAMSYFLHSTPLETGFKCIGKYAIKDGSSETANAVEEAKDLMMNYVGNLNLRSTRVSK